MLFKSSVFPLFFFFFNDTATTEIYTLSLHDALPICEARFEREPDEIDPPEDRLAVAALPGSAGGRRQQARLFIVPQRDRKSTRLNSSHTVISYAVFCLKEKRRQD